MGYWIMLRLGRVMLFRFRSGGRGRRGLLANLLFQASPHAVKLAVQCGIIQFMHASAGQDNDIHSG